MQNIQNVAAHDVMSIGSSAPKWGTLRFRNKAQLESEREREREWLERSGEEGIL